MYILRFHRLSRGAYSATRITLDLLEDGEWASQNTFAKCTAYLGIAKVNSLGFKVTTLSGPGAPAKRTSSNVTSTPTNPTCS